MKIPIEVSARHIHLSQEDLEVLFGAGYSLKKLRELSQEGEFAAEEKINIEFNNKTISDVRIIGPTRKKSQLEISKTDCFILGINAPVRLSGDLEGTPGIFLIGPSGSLKIEEGVIVAKRHLHCNSEEAEKIGVKNNDLVSVKIEGERSLIFNEVVVRVGKNFSLAMHIDTDEANASGITMKGEGKII